MHSPALTRAVTGARRAVAAVDCLLTGGSQVEVILDCRQAAVPQEVT
jgi:hypothetical protein